MIDLFETRTVFGQGGINLNWKNRSEEDYQCFICNSPLTELYLFECQYRPRLKDTLRGHVVEDGFIEMFLCQKHQKTTRKTFSGPRDIVGCDWWNMVDNNMFKVSE